MEGKHYASYYTGWWDSNIPHLQIYIYICEGYLAVCLTIIPALLLSLEEEQDTGWVSKGSAFQEMELPGFTAGPTVRDPSSS